MGVDHIKTLYMYVYRMFNNDKYIYETEQIHYQTLSNHQSINQLFKHVNELL